VLELCQDDGAALAIPAWWSIAQVFSLSKFEGSFRCVQTVVREAQKAEREQQVVFLTKREK
jgi:hypothetical protein